MRDETMKKYFKIEFIRNRRLVENYNNWDIYINVELLFLTWIISILLRRAC